MRESGSEASTLMDEDFMMQRDDAVRCKMLWPLMLGLQSTQVPIIIEAK